jgi:hypothetical protein
VIAFERSNGAVGGGLEPPTVQLATVQLWWSTPVARRRHYAAFIPYHHPRDRRARLPISTSYSVRKSYQEDRRVTPLDQLDNANIVDGFSTLQIFQENL